MKRDELKNIMNDTITLLYDIRNTMPRGNEVNIPWQIERYLNKHVIKDIDTVLTNLAKVNTALHTPGRL